MNESGGKEVVVVGVDESDHGIYALEWTVDHLFSRRQPPNPPPFKLIVVHAKPNPVSVIGGVGPGNFSRLLLWP